MTELSVGSSQQPSATNCKECLVSLRIWCVT